MSSNTISKFPKFTKLLFGHKNNINKIIRNYPPYSDYNFTSLWSYDTQDDIELSMLNNNLVIKFTDYITTKPFYSFFGKNKFLETSNTLLDLCKKQKIEPILKLIPEIFIQNQKLLEKKFIIKEERDNFDYIYYLKRIFNLAGREFYKKRQACNTFLKKYSHFKIRILQVNERLVQDDMIKLFVKWEKIKKKNRNETTNELQAIQRLFKKVEYFNLISLGIFLDENLIAFSICEKEKKGYVVGHFAKADYSYKGIFEVLLKYTASKLLEEDFKWINMEQDMGIEGLRYSKTIWRPVHFLKKYTISPK
jgi:uncharacterized protein